MIAQTREQDYYAYSEHVARLREACIDDLGHVALSSITLDLFTPSSPEVKTPVHTSAAIAETALMHTVYAPQNERPPISVVEYANSHALAA